MESITIREALQEDYQTVKALYTQRLRFLATTQPDRYTEAAVETSLKEETFLNTLENPDWTFLLGLVDGKTVGAMQLSVDEDPLSDYLTPSKYVWIEELIVADGQPAEAVATAFLEAAEAWAVERGIRMIDSIVYSFNAPLLAASKQRGYEPVSTRVRRSF